jgi:L-alanine-DL-glutamate epimerase-like enolase superfamily enzyme
VRISAIAIDRYRLPLAPPFLAAWDPRPRDAFTATIVRVETDEGVVGIGSGDAMAGFDDYAHLFVGRDPLAIDELATTIETIDFHAGRCWPLEVALWDIAGQVAGAPVAHLLGGARDAIAVYASTGTALAPAARAESAVRLREQGFRALKIRVDPGTPQALENGLAAVEATRRAVGDGMDIMVDLNQGWRMPGDTRAPLPLPVARSIAARLAELGVLWLEEPLDGSDLAGLAELRRMSRMRIAGGEMTRTLAGSMAEVEAGAYDVLQADVVLAGGISRGRTVGRLAMARGRWYTPHTWTNGIGLLANLQAVCGVGGGPYLEYPVDPPGWTPERRDFMLEAPVQPDADGLVRVPDRPGLGVALDEGVLSRYRVA